MNKAQIAVDHQKYLIVVLFILCLLVILRFSARYKKRTSIDPYERATPDALREANSDAAELDSLRKDGMKGSKAKGKQLILAVLVLVILIGFRIAGRELICNIPIYHLQKWETKKGAGFYIRTFLYLLRFL